MAPYDWKAPRLQCIPLDAMEMMKLFRRLVVNHAILRVLCRGQEGSAVLAWMAQGLLNLLGKVSKQQSSDVQQAAFSELQELAEALMMLMELKTPQASSLEMLSSAGAAEVSDDQANLSARGLICNAIAKSQYWRARESRAREVASALISLKPEIDVFTRELPDLSLSKLAKACLRFPVWVDGLPSGQSVLNIGQWGQS